MQNGRVRLLLIEDSAELAELFVEQASVFTDGAMEVRVCDTLTGALSTLRAASWDLVVVDLTLPDSAGLPTFSAVYAEARGTPVFILSGLSDPALIARATAEGCAGYLQKALGGARALFTRLMTAAGATLV